jgi:hypothetical protein
LILADRLSKIFIQEARKKKLFFVL